jgi:hypothetical protein
MTATLATCDIAQDMLLSALEIEKLRSTRARLEQLTGRAHHVIDGCRRAQLRDAEFMRAVRACA